MNNKLFLYTVIFLYFNTLVPIECINTFTKKTQQYADQYLKPYDSAIPNTSFMYNINLIFDYYLNGRHNFNTYSLEEKKSLKMLCNLPIINLLMQLINQAYPLAPFTLLSNNPIALTTAYKLFELANIVFPNASAFKYTIFKSTFPLSICSLAFYNDPTLFTRYTYISLFDVFNDYITAMPMPCIILYPVLRLYHTLFHHDIIKHHAIQKINYMFDAKQAMFLCATILACFNIKLKNKTILTNPLYWLLIGLAHLSFTQYKWAPASDNSKNLFFDEALLLEIMKYFNLKDTNNFFCIMLKYTFHNAIPFGAVLLNMMYSFLKK